MYRQRRSNNSYGINNTAGVTPFAVQVARPGIAINPAYPFSFSNNRYNTLGRSASETAAQQRNLCYQAAQQIRSSKGVFYCTYAKCANYAIS